jgi:hypothetical protein
MIPPADLSLLEEYLAGRLPPEQTQIVEDRLGTEPTFARAYLLLAREEVLLTRWAHSALALHREEMAYTSPTVPQLPRRPSRWRKRLGWVAGLAAAACVLLTLWAFQNRNFPFEGTPLSSAHPLALALVEETQGTVFLVEGEGKTPVRPGQSLHPGQWLQTVGESSFAVLRYPDRTRLEMGASTLIRLLDVPGPAANEEPAGNTTKKVYLAQGTVSADSMPDHQEEALILATPHVEVRGQGTSFRLASAPMATRIDLEHGSAQLKRMSDGKIIEIPSDSYTIALQTGPVKTLPLPAKINEPLAHFNEGSGPILALDATPQGEVAIGGWGGKITLWDPEANKVRHQLAGQFKRAGALACSADGAFLAVGGPNRKGKHSRVMIWRLDSRQSWATLTDLGDVQTLAFSPDSQMIAIASGDRKGHPILLLWDVHTKKEMARFPSSSRLLCLAFSPDGRFLAVGNNNGIGQMWERERNELLWNLRCDTRPLQALAFSPDGQTLATGGQEGIVQLRDPATGAARLTFPGPCGEVRSLAFSPDGRFLAGATAGVVRLWDVATGKELTTIKGHRYATTQVCFSADGQHLITAGWDRQVKIWNLLGKKGGPV